MAVRAKAVWAGMVFWLEAFLLQLAARQTPGFGQWYAVTVYPVLVKTMGRLFGLFPFSVSEIGLYLLLLGGVIYGLTHFRRPLMILKKFFLVSGVIAFLYTACCGVNYYRLPFSAYLNLEIRESTVEELKNLCVLLKEKTEETAQKLLEEGSFWPDEDEIRNFPQTARVAMQALGEEYPALSGFYPQPKPVAFSWILSVQSLAGVYSPFTIEANYNRQMVSYNIPHTACHELSHLRGFMREDEANFIAFLGCIGSDSLYFQYSGYLSAYIYAHNALYAREPEQALELYYSLPKEVLSDLRENNQFWQQFEGRIAQVSSQVNDTYLKANSQEEGLESYGRMVDLLLAYYRNS